MAETVPTPVAPDRARIETFRFEAGGGIPNNPRLPVVLIRGALAGAEAEEAIHALYRANGWGGTWSWTVYDFHHYHSNAHEALTVARGEARLMLGGVQGREVTVTAGDLAVLPAGTGHRRLEESDDFAVCGAYPRGQEDRDLLKAGADDLAAAAKRIDAVPLPRADPLYGPDGPLMRLWS